MAGNTKTITLGYSNNGGSSFTTQTFTMYAYSLVKVPAEEIKKRKYAYQRRLEEAYAQRYRLRFILGEDNFTEANDPSETRWLFLQAWAVGKLKRFYCADNLDTYTAFNSSTNTNYLVFEGDPPSFDEEDRGNRQTPISMMTRDVV